MLLRYLTFLLIPCHRRKAVYSFFHLMFILANTSMAQNYQWSKAFDGVIAGGYASSACIAFDGSVISTGFFNGTFDFDPGPGFHDLTSQGGEDVYISKLDSNGNFIWGVQVGGIADDRGMDLAVDASGNIYVTGYFRGTSDFDPGPGVNTMTSAGESDVFILKISPSSGLIWSKQISGTQSQSVRSLSMNAFGDIHVIGSCFGVTDFDPGPATTNITSNGNLFILKLDNLGNFIWVKLILTSGYISPGSIHIDMSNNVLITGSFIDTIDCDPGLGLFNLSSPFANGYEIFVLKLNSAGNFLWAKKAGSEGPDRGLSITADQWDNLLVTGNFTDTVDFDPGPGDYNLAANGSNLYFNTDIFVWKLNPYGNLIWARNMGGVSNDTGFEVKTNSYGSVYTVGRFDGTADFDPGTGTANISSFIYEDGFISCLDSSGQFLWAKGIIGPDFTLCSTIDVDPFGNLVISGNFVDSANFNPPYQNFLVSISSNSSTANFVARYGNNVVGNDEYLNREFHIFPNPFTQSFTVKGCNTEHATEIIITNIQGQIIKYIKVNGAEEVLIEINEVPGVYFARIISESITSTYKIIKYIK